MSGGWRFKPAREDPNREKFQSITFYSMYNINTTGGKSSDGYACYAGVVVTGPGIDVVCPVVDMNMSNLRPALRDCIRDKDMVLIYMFSSHTSLTLSQRYVQVAGSSGRKYRCSAPGDPIQSFRRYRSRRH